MSCTRCMSCKYYRVVYSPIYKTFISDCIYEEEEVTRELGCKYVYEKKEEVKYESDNQREDTPEA